MTDPADVETAVVDAHRRGWALVLAATARVARDLDLAEECVQEAYAAALVLGRATGSRTTRPPGSPPRRGDARWTPYGASGCSARSCRCWWNPRRCWTRLPWTNQPRAEAADVVPDERLRLIFLCCHPALAQDAQLALTLRLVCGVPTADIARAFLVSEPTMAARLTRAKKKISAARIPYRVPAAAELPDRLRAVLGVIHVLFTTGHTAPSGASLVRTDLVDQALHLSRMLRDVMPDEREVWGLLALLLVTDARRSTRVDADGRLLRLEQQDRSQWDRAAIAEAHDLIVAGLRGGRPGRYVLQAAIASLYAEAPTYDETDWPQIVTLYDTLLTVWPSPVVALNRTVAVARVAGPVQALAEVEELERGGRLAGYQYLPAVKADLLRWLGRTDEASVAYRQALELTRNEAEREFLSERLDLVTGRGQHEGWPEAEGNGAS